MSWGLCLLNLVLSLHCCRRKGWESLLAPGLVLQPSLCLELIVN